ncbi:MAG: CPBP family intramembrane metalloprotease [Anaerolineae bacterium]|nr:CPBP family intramembrane metalloprotease [Anaerolineae bacterium]
MDITGNVAAFDNSVRIGDQERQYALGKILGLWAVVTLPMLFLSLVVAPFVLPLFPGLPPVSVYVLLLTPGMVWQLALSLWVIRSEEGDLRWATIRRRIWLNPPLQPKTGRPRRRLYGWLLPCLAVAGLSFTAEAFWTMLSSYLTRFSSFPWIALFHGDRYTNMIEFAGPIFSGQWWALGLALVVWILSALCAEEFFFRGILLPRMRGVFGGCDWLVNAILYGLYYLYKPWAIVFRLIVALVVAWPARRFRSNWMAIAVRAVGGVGLVAVALFGVSTPSLDALPATLMLPYISRHPVAWVNSMNRVKTEIPAYDPASSSSFPVDLRNSDLSSFDLRDVSKDLFYADFDNLTTWPPAERMPADFDPQHIMEMGKNPGLGLRQLHVQGITGKGVNIAIIDMPLLTNHQEYADRLKWYEEVNSDNGSARMHGAAVASIAVGKTVGVAPGANLYYIGYADDLETGLFYPHYLALGMRRILEINERLPEDQKIRVISISSGWMPTDSYAQAVAEEARDAGMLVICSSVELVHGFYLHGLGRNPLANPDAFESYEPGLWWAQGYYGGAYQMDGRLLAPMDSRTTASPTGAGDYVYYRQGGLSWSIPYIAGMYALAAQVDPTITPDRFWSLALETGRTIEIEHEGQSYALGKIADPQALIMALQAER